MSRSIVEVSLEGDAVISSEEDMLKLCEDFSKKVEKGIADRLCVPVSKSIGTGTHTRRVLSNRYQIDGSVESMHEAMKDLASDVVDAFSELGESEDLTKLRRTKVSAMLMQSMQLARVVGDVPVEADHVCGWWPKEPGVTSIFLSVYIWNKADKEKTDGRCAT